MNPTDFDVNSGSTKREDFEFTPKTSSPLFINSSDIPGLPPVVVLFFSSNFGGWRKSMIVSLSSRNKIAFIDGTLPKSLANSPEAKQWDRCNNIVISDYFSVL